jgi:ribosome-associated protein
MDKTIEKKPAVKKAPVKKAPVKKAAAEKSILEFKPATKRKVAPKLNAPFTDDDLVKEILDAAWTKNAFATRVYDVAGVVDYTDRLVIFSGRSERHVTAIAAAIEGLLKDKKIKPSGVEGREAGAWVLLDYGNVIVHVFEKHNRTYYDLDRLWADATIIKIQEPQWVIDFTRMESSDLD